jgi:proline iminopeptidase
VSLLDTGWLLYVSGTGIDPSTTWAPAYRRNLRERLRQTPQTQPGTPSEEREAAILQWSADYADPAMAYAERAATPWFGIKTAINGETAAYLAATDVAALCRGLDRPVLIIDGDHDIRPRSAVDSLHRALPDASRVTIEGAGHLPWVEDPTAFTAAVTGFLDR